jgi:hypothetical protein
MVFLVRKAMFKLVFFDKSWPQKHNKRKNWVTFRYHSPLIHKVTNLLKNYAPCI